MRANSVCAQGAFVTGFAGEGEAGRYGEDRVEDRGKGRRGMAEEARRVGKEGNTKIQRGKKKPVGEEEPPDQLRWGRKSRGSRAGAICPFFVAWQVLRLEARVRWSTSPAAPPARTRAHSDPMRSVSSRKVSRIFRAPSLGCLSPRGSKSSSFVPQGRPSAAGDYVMAALAPSCSLQARRRCAISVHSPQFGLRGSASGRRQWSRTGVRLGAVRSDAVDDGGDSATRAPGGSCRVIPGRAPLVRVRRRCRSGDKEFGVGEWANAGRLEPGLVVHVVGQPVSLLIALNATVTRDPLEG